MESTRVVHEKDDKVVRHTKVKEKMQNCRRVAEGGADLQLLLKKKRCYHNSVIDCMDMEVT